MEERDLTGQEQFSGLHLAQPESSDAEAAVEMLQEWHRFGGRMNPGLLRSCSGNFGEWLSILKAAQQEDQAGGAVPQTLYFLKDGSGRILGAASIRHFLNETNLIDGGHIAYGIAPAYRGHGLGEAILRLALGRAKEMGITRALITCDEDNLPSRRVIERCGGVLENIMPDEDGIPIRRYWITCSAIS